MLNNPSICILIPVYKPTHKLIDLISSFSGKYDFLVIDDGSGENFKSLFNSLHKFERVKVIHHSINQGKGQALKTGFDYYFQNYPRGIGVVTADADGQHLPDDIKLVIQTLAANPDKFVLGVRKFDNNVPFRSQLGNTITRFIFRLFTGKSISDTQTGLRAIPRSLIPSLILLKANRYDYELEMLLSLCSRNIKLNEVHIKTIYEDNNSSSHFNPLIDSIKIYFVFIRFSAVAILSAIIDYVVFSFLILLIDNILISTVTARVISASFNFSAVRKVVFKSNGTLSTELLKYFLLAISLVSISYTLTLSLMENLGLNIFLSKLLSESILFLASFSIQRIFIFKSSD